MIRATSRFAVAVLSFAFVTHADTSAPPEVLEWMRSSAVPLKTVEAGNGFEDLAPLKAMIGPDVRVIGLGEATHGSREHFQAKHRLFEFLVHEMGYTVFGIEASLPDCIAINDYVLHGKGDPEKAVAGQGFWTWSTEEVLELVKWMRAYNEDSSHATKLKFYGYDMQNEQSAANAVLQYLMRVDPAAAAEVRPSLEPFFRARFMSGGGTAEQFEAAKAVAKDLARRLDEKRDAYIAASSADEFAIYRRCADVCAQALELIEDLRNRASSLGPMRDRQIWATIRQDIEDLRDGLRQHLPEEAAKTESLFAALEDLQQFHQDFDSAAEAKRDEWQSAANAVNDAIVAAKDKLELSVYGKLSNASQNLLDYFTMARDLSVTAASAPPRENIRDRYMAENVAWILSHEGASSKIAVWAHNGHVMCSRTDPDQIYLAMGDYLRSKFGEDYFVIGLGFNKGDFQAVPSQTTGGGSLREWSVKEAKADSLDAAFAAVGVPMFVLDVRPAAAPDESIRRWLAVDQPMRMVGAVFDPAWETQAYRPLPPGKAFDAILFTETTTRARPLKAMPHASMGVDPPMNRPRLGVQLAADNQPGIRIDKIMEGYAAEAAGLREGDRILKLNDEDVDSVHGFVSALSKHPTGSVVKVTIKRGEETSVIEVKLTAPKTN